MNKSSLASGTSASGCALLCVLSVLLSVVNLATRGFLHLVVSDIRQALNLLATKERPWVIFVVDLDRRAPDWSPKGDSIIFSGLPEELSGDARSTSIHVVDLKTHNISTLPGSEGLYCPRWSPDGRYISATTADGSKLMLFHLASQQWMELTKLSQGRSKLVA